MAFNNIELQVVNQASILLNDTAVPSLDVNSSFVLKAKNAFKIIFEQALSVSDWRFATVIRQLDKLTEKPEYINFAFKMKLPADLLAVQLIFVTGQSRDTLVDYIPFADNIIYSNIDTLSVEYRRKTEINDAPQYFIHYLGFAVADYLALGFTKIQKKEQIEKATAKALAKALYVDRQNYPMQAIKSSPALHHDLSGFDGRFIGDING